MEITRKSKLTGITRTQDIPVTEDQLKDWQEGMLIQKAMPNLTAEQREFIMTGITDDEWQEMLMQDNFVDDRDDYNLDSPSNDFKGYDDSDYFDED